MARERFESLFPLCGALESAKKGRLTRRFALFPLRCARPMISASDDVMKIIINPAGGDIKNVSCQNDPIDTGAARLHAGFRAGFRADLRASVSDPRGAAAAHFIRLR
ncbi:hypothetical protein CI15_06855 [Paraburkholderia monticola]|uniref:Uncharacterized protein n=2 Tax=Paraburkholderia monticola TaxID=1399968 RepID=A0A149PY69_9BURK|nr:hypothetical protein CI15_06855 [Paraburkholderia monticola]